MGAPLLFNKTIYKKCTAYFQDRWQDMIELQFSLVESKYLKNVLVQISDNLKSKFQFVLNLVKKSRKRHLWPLALTLFFEKSSSLLLNSGGSFAQISDESRFQTLW